MDNDYWINEDYIIFKPEFNKSISNYINVIKNYKNLIFSNYDDYKICISTNNIYSDKYNKNHKSSKFNQPVLNSLDNLTQLQQLTFGFEFNQPVFNCLNNLQKSLEKLYLPTYYNMKIKKYKSKMCYK